MAVIAIYSPLGDYFNSYYAKKKLSKKLILSTIKIKDKSKVSNRAHLMNSKFDFGAKNRIKLSPDI